MGEGGRKEKKIGWGERGEIDYAAQAGDDERLPKDGGGGEKKGGRVVLSGRGGKRKV